MPLPVQSALGVLTLVALAYIFSENRPQVRLSIIIYSLLIQLGLALVLTKAPGSQIFFSSINSVVLSVDHATQRGTAFVFGYLGGGDIPFAATESGNSFVLAFQALPLIIVLSAITSLLNYWGVLPFIIRIIARALNMLLPMSGATAFASAANIFMGMIESPLFIKPYLQRLTRSDLFILMTVGMATIAGTVMVIYIGFLNPVLPDAAGHLLTASVISVPAAIGIALLMVPSAPLTEQTAEPDARQEIGLSSHHSSFDAIVGGTQQGLQLCLQIAALLIVFVALVALINAALQAAFPDLWGAPITLQRLLAIIMTPFAWLLGIPSAEIIDAGELLGTKIVLNEFIALQALGDLGDASFSPRTVLILSYALS
ncbi:MAG: NupC/NupG family nucleoside CNT transporter, partial [Gammaproteobacteria bacterium]